MTEYLMKCTSVKFDFETTLYQDSFYSNCYIAIKDNMIILIEDESTLDQLIKDKDIKEEQESNDFNDFGGIDSFEQIHFDTLLKRKIGRLFIGYRVIINL